MHKHNGKKEEGMLHCLLVEKYNYFVQSQNPRWVLSKNRFTSFKLEYLLAWFACVCVCIGAVVGKILKFPLEFF